MTNFKIVTEFNNIQSNFADTYTVYDATCRHNFTEEAGSNLPNLQSSLKIKIMTSQQVAKIGTSTKFMLTFYFLVYHEY